MDGCRQRQDASMIETHFDPHLELQSLDQRLATIEKLLAKTLKVELEKREPIDQTVYISATRWWAVDYRNRKHCFLWIPGNALTLSFEDYGQGVVQPQSWVNLGLPVGIRMFALGAATDTQILLRFTDEPIP